MIAEYPAGDVLVIMFFDFCLFVDTLEGIDRGYILSYY